MRASTLISVVLALVLAGLAVLGVRQYLDAQRVAITQQAEQGAEASKNFVVVAKGAMGFGEKITADKVELMEWASDRVPAGSFTRIEDVVGPDDETARYVLSSIGEGEMITPAKITMPGQRAKLSTAISPGMKAVSIRVNDVLGVAGFVLPGDRVDVMLTRGDGSGTFVDILLQGVRVVAIDQIADDRKDQPSVVRTVTFEVTTEQAQKLTLAANVGTLSLALRNVAAPADEKVDRITLVDLNETERANRDQELQRAQAELAAARAAQDTVSAEALARITELQAQIEALKAAQTQPAASAAAAAPVEAEPVDDFTNVGVIRGGRRDEYRVLSDFGIN
jgi:pilus assembly protein CpaB